MRFRALARPHPQLLPVEYDDAAFAEAVADTEWDEEDEEEY
jgi:hypothetical protein